MNKNIKKILDQAGYKNYDPFVTAQIVKFAEMLVQDCAEQCEHYSRRIMKYNQTGSNAVEDCAKILKDHYGLTEPTDE